MTKLLLVGLGGFAGAVLRYLISGAVQNAGRSVAFPYGTFAVNIIGCFVIGLLAQLVETRAALTAEMRLLLMVGLLGSFTTYSTFGSETFALIQDQRWGVAMLNICLHVVLGLSAVMMGRFSAQLVWR